jgi:MFS family permease
MISRLRPPAPPTASRQSAQTPRSAGDGLDGQLQNSYGRPFWLAYVANLLVMVAFAVLYRYADFVTLLGGTEYHLGWIVGIGMVGSLLMRFLLGTGIDRHGPRLVWLASLVVFAAVCFAHLGVTRHDGVAIYLLRIIFCSAIAGVFGSSMTFISGRVPAVRIAEMIGMLGTSGFVGVVLGTVLGDLLCGSQELQRWQVDRMFIVAGLLGIVAVLFAALATHTIPPPRPRRKRPPLVWLLRRYQPGTVLLTAVAAGAALGLPTTFLRTYAAELDIPRLGFFFGIYAPVAIITRVLTRRWPARIGLPPMILLGLFTLALGQLLLLVVVAEWLFIVPGVVFGIAHAIIFPTVVGAGTHTFPGRYRGLGMMVVLSAFDLGTLIGSPAIGALLHYSQQLGLPSYPTTFVVMSAMLVLVGAVYAASCRTPAARGDAAMSRPARQKRSLRKDEAAWPPSGEKRGRGAAQAGKEIPAA